MNVSMFRCERVLGIMLTLGILSGVVRAQDVREGDAENERRRSAGLIHELFTERTFEDGAGGFLRYQFLVPEGYRRESTYPLVVCLHGAAGGTEAAKVLVQPEMRRRYPCFVLAPEARSGESWGHTSRGRRRGSTGQNRTRINVQPFVMQVIKNMMEEYTIDPDRVYITGQSMGGGGTLSFISTHPSFFAAAVPVCPAGDLTSVETIARLPLWFFQGADDGAVPAQRTRDLVAVLRQAGGNPKYTEFPGVKHDSWTPAYATDALWEWFFAQERKVR